MNLEPPKYRILYNGKNISEDISAQVLNLTYSDKITGESDTLELTIEDADRRWQNEWSPTKGDVIEAFIEQKGKELNCGKFQVDETTLTSSVAGDIFEIKGIAALISKPIRTAASYAHAEKSLKEIANTVAAANGLKLVGNVPAYQIGRVNQYRETPLNFLNRIGNDYGCVFSIRGTDLVFTFYKELEEAANVLSFKRGQIVSLNITDTTVKTFKKARVRHLNQDDNEVVEFETGEQNNGSADSLEIHSRAENRQQAEAKASHALSKKNTAGVSGDIVVPGNILLVSGVNFELTGYGIFSGKYHINQSDHMISRDGAYQTTMNVKRVATVPLIKQKA